MHHVRILHQETHMHQPILQTADNIILRKNIIPNPYYNLAEYSDISQLARHLGDMTVLKEEQTQTPNYHKKNSCSVVPHKENKDL